MDMCWAVLYASFFMGMGLLVIILTKPELVVEYEWLFLNGFYAYFGFACGPIGLYVLWNSGSNLMVFHS
jgi:hypothetical protein